jgi:serine/threonine-protein kinase RsbW
MPTAGDNHGGRPAGALRLHNRREDVEHAASTILAEAERAHYPPAACFALRLAVEEALSNAFRHGHARLPSEAEVLFSWRVGADTIAVTVEDQGPGFDHASVPDPTTEENLEKISGRGIHLMRSFMTSVEYNSAGNRVTMTFTRPADD